jgi:hypothetical protein
VNIVGSPNTPEAQQVTLTNLGPGWANVDLSTRALTREVSDTGVQSFTLDPGNPTTNSGTMPNWDDYTYVYQTETFNVPATYWKAPSRLEFSADYQYSGQNSVVHVALFEPDGTFAAFTSLPAVMGAPKRRQLAITMCSKYHRVRPTSTPASPWPMTQAMS